jgi:TolB-like protein
MQSRIRTVAVVLCLLAATQALAQKVIGEAAKELAEQIAASAAKQQKHKIAVIPFRELDGRTTILGTFLAEELVTDLFMTGDLDIVERSMLDKVMAELKLGQSGAIDPETAKQVGKIVGVDAIVSGSITDLQSYVGVNCRLIDTETGRIFGAAQTKIVKDADLQKIIGASMPTAAAPAPPPAAAPAKKTEPLQQRTVDGIQFEVVGCRDKAGNVTCNLMLTNQSQEDKHITVSLSNGDNSSILIDDQSSEYRATGGSLGIKNAENQWGLDTTLVAEVPLKASVRFSGVPESVSGIRLLRVRCDIGYNTRMIDFKDIPLTR